MKKRILSLVLTLCMLLGLLPGTAWAAADKGVTVESNSDKITKSIYANGNAITLKAAAGDASKTIIYMDNAAVELTGIEGDETGGYDLSDYAIYGGSLNAPVTSSSITMEGGKVYCIWGGGYAYRGDTTDATVTDNTSVTITGGTVCGKVYGGGRASGSGFDATVKGNTTVTINGGTIGNAGSPTDEDVYNGEVYGGGHSQNGGTAGVKGNTTVTINDGTIASKSPDFDSVVCGGGSSEDTIGGTEIKITGGTVEGTVCVVTYGAALADGKKATVNISGGTVGGVSDSDGSENDILQISGKAVIGNDKNGICLDADERFKTVTIDSGFSGSAAFMAWDYSAIVEENPLAATYPSAKMDQLSLVGDGAADYELYLDGSDVKIRTKAAPHSHAVSADCSASDGTQVAFTPLTATSGELTTGSYYLSEDIALDGDLSIPSSNTVKLCLNGHVLNLNGNHQILVHGNLSICDCNGSSQTHKFSVDTDGLWTLDETNGTKTVTGGVITGRRPEHDLDTSGYSIVNAAITMRSNGSLILYGGNLCGNKGGAVETAASTPLTMYGGKISGNLGELGSGIYLAPDIDSPALLTGGEISENVCVVSYGGAVYVGKENLTLSGSIQIRDNEYKDPSGTFSPRNVTIRNDVGAFFTVDGAMGADVKVGVTFFTKTSCVLGKGTNHTITQDDLAKFNSDLSAFNLRLTDNNEIEAYKPTLPPYDAPDSGEGYAIDYAQEKITVDSGYEINTKSDGTGEEVNTGAAVTPGSTLYIRKSGDDAYTASGWVVVTVPARPSAPSGVSPVSETVLGANDGKITGVSTAMEYSTDGGTNWTDCPGAEVTDLAPGDYQVRTKATDAAFASAAAVVSVGAGGGSPSHTHAWASSWTKNATHHWHECKSADCPITDNSQKDGYAAHTEDTGSITVNPTADAEGVMTYTCSVCGATIRIEAIPKLGTAVGKVEVKPNTPTVTVDETALQGVAEEAKQADKSVTVTLTVEEVENPADKTAIEAVMTTDKAEYLDLSLVKTTVDGSSITTDKIDDTGAKVLEIVVPFDFTGKTGVAVYRKHGSSAEALQKAGTKADGTFQLDETGGKVYIYTSKFSTYAIGYGETAGTYTVTVQNDGHGTASASPSSAAAGSEITLAAVPNSGYRFQEWQVVSGGVTISSSKFTMPAGNVTVKAVFAYIGGGSSGSSSDGDDDEPTYRPSVERAKHGDVTVRPSAPEQGDRVTITVKPDKGYEVEDVTVTDRNGDPVKVKDNGDGTYTFTQPKGKVSVEATFQTVQVPQPVQPAGDWSDCRHDAACPIHAYTDADPGAWYHDGVHYCLEKSLMNGFTDGTFKPDATLSRAQLAQILYNLEGRPALNGASPFTDVANNAWCASAVIWANQNGIVSGYGNGLFGPNNPITREQLATMLWRYAKAKGYDVSVGENTNILGYNDFSKIHEYAIPALQWATGAGVMNGKGGGILDPTGTATRAQAAVMLQRFCTRM